ncbi:hypothetical protein FYK55_11780 [Roseiconus nitratireducens]|uniref:Preprotein translocase subunit SecA n=1 Tax=Roseiconus nitratireducens TaxID=2605748 RepID=A0A5M6DBZ3_9BACT|nr:preprotein translocase subunit SecA [Roseiconus nitratireducens]KAA5543842.1 hypothetical protein FYK55_11780 [Roseiconus nitratireducens]
MSLFKLLFGRRTPENIQLEKESLWLTREAKFAGIARQLQHPASPPPLAILLMAHFPDTQSELAKLAKQSAGEVPVMAVLANELTSRIARDLQIGPDAIIDVIAAERHPLVSVDDRLMEDFGKQLNCRCRVHVHQSLEDPLMQRFSGQSIIDLLRSMGMREDEAIESRMVGRRIRDAQKKITAQAVGNTPAESAEEWMRINLP